MQRPCRNAERSTYYVSVWYVWLVRLQWLFMITIATAFAILYVSNVGWPPGVDSIAIMLVPIVLLLIAFLIGQGIARVEFADDMIILASLSGRKTLANQNDVVSIKRRSALGLRPAGIGADLYLRGGKQVGLLFNLKGYPELISRLTQIAKKNSIRKNGATE